MTLIGWDVDGEMLAIANATTATFVLYELSNSELKTIDFSTGSRCAFFS